MSLIGFLWSCVVSSFAIFLVARLMKSVQCDSFLDAFKVSVLYSIFFSIAFHFFLQISIIPLLIATILTFGLVLLAAPFAYWVSGFAICVVCLYLADQLVEGFQIESLGATVVAAAFIGLANVPLKWILVY